MNKNLEEISDGKRYGLNDMVRAACNDCAGCSSCCEDMGESIILDPLDIYELTKNLNTTFENLLKEQIELHVADGMILPNLKMTDKDVCPFLKEKRCSIHSFRPGICRVYTVEGNSGDACKIKSYDLNYQSIKGYGLMNW